MSNKASKSKRGPKQSWAKGFKQLWDRMDTLGKAWDDRFDGLSDRFRKLTVANAQQLGGVNANQQIHSDVLEKLDINVQALAKMIQNIYERLEQVDVFLARLAEYGDYGEVFRELSAQDITEIKDRAGQTYTDLLKNMFVQVHEEREAAMRAHREAAMKEKAAAEQAKKEKTAAEEIEKELQEAEKETVGDPGGQGAAIPEGAEVFGG